MSTKKDDRVTKRKVTMKAYSIKVNEDGSAVAVEHVATDYVRPDFLDAYVAEAKGNGRWTTVEVSDEPDAGPGGYDGQTVVPETLDHPLAGKTFAATEEN